MSAVTTAVGAGCSAGGSAVARLGGAGLSAVATAVGARCSAGESAVARLADAGLSAAYLADRAVAALVAEAVLTPKPGLVDRRGSGAHHDLDLACLLRSAESLRDGFWRMAACSVGHAPSVELREELGAIGREAERAMLAATGGSNAHRGAIWTLGLLVAGRAMVGGALRGVGFPAHRAAANSSLPTTVAGRVASLTYSPDRFAVTKGGLPTAVAGVAASLTRLSDRLAVADGCVPTAVADVAATLARLPDRFAAPNTTSHGARACQAHGVVGARGEAQAGFPHVIHVGLPRLRAARAGGVAEVHAQLNTLMAIMMTLDDTCVLHRGGRAALDAAQSGARAVLDAGGTSTPEGWRALHALDEALLQRWVSPGGCADLLAACLFLDDEDVWRG